MNIENRDGAVLEVVNGHEVRQYLRKENGRWYVYIPSETNLLPVLKCRRTINRNRYVWMRANGSRPIPPGHEVHHKNRKRDDDTPSNLELLTHAEHRAEHAGESHMLGKRHKPSTIAKMRAIAKARGNNGVWDGKGGHFESTKELMSEKASGERNASFRHDVSLDDVKAAITREGSMSAAARALGCSVSAIRYRLNETTTSVDWKAIPDEELLVQFNRCDRVVGRLAEQIHAPGSSLWRRLKKIQGASA